MYDTASEGMAVAAHNCVFDFSVLYQCFIAFRIPIPKMKAIDTMLACRLVSCASDLKLASQAKGHLDLAVDEGQYSSSAVAALEALIEDVSCHHNVVVSVVMTSILVQSQGQVPYGCDVDYGPAHDLFTHCPHMQFRLNSVFE